MGKAIAQPETALQKYGVDVSETFLSISDNQKVLKRFSESYEAITKLIEQIINKQKVGFGGEVMGKHGSAIRTISKSEEINKLDEQLEHLLHGILLNPHYRFRTDEEHVNDYYKMSLFTINVLSKVVDAFFALELFNIGFAKSYTTLSLPHFSLEKKEQDLIKATREIRQKIVN